MNAQTPLTDDTIRAAIARRASGPAEGDLRARVLAATATSRQRSGWLVRLGPGELLPQRNLAVTLWVAVVLLVFAALVAGLVGYPAVDRTTPARLGGLAYLSDGDLYLAGPVGESPRLIWNLPASEDIASRQLVWVDAETVLLHIYDQPQGIHLVNMTTGAHRLLDPGALLGLSPDRRLALIDSATIPVRRTVIEIASGAVVREVLGTVSGYPPQWSPDGRSILGESPDMVYRVDIATGERTDLATGLCCGLSPHYPTWSPDGTRVVYVDYHEPAGVSIYDKPPRECAFRCGTIWTVDAAGGEPTRLTPELGSETSPAISPDGRWMAFLEEHLTPMQTVEDLVVVAVDGSGRNVLTPPWQAGQFARNQQTGAAFSWDPDSAGLSLLSNVGTLWRVRLDGQPWPIEGPAMSEFAWQVLP